MRKNSTPSLSAAARAPTHGGIALGFDRLCAIHCATSSIGDVKVKKLE